MNSYTLVLICIVSCVGLKFWCSYKVLDGRMDEKKKKKLYNSYLLFQEKSRSDLLMIMNT